MSKVDLFPNEAIILRDSAITHDRGKLFDDGSAELVLTNLALIVLHKNFWGSVKDVQRFPLDQIRIANNEPQVVIGSSQDGDRQLHVYFSHGIEAFELGESDDDEDAGFLENILTSPKDKESRNLREWQTSISRAVLALPQNASLHVALSAGSGQAPSNPSSAPHSHITKKCIGCMAPLSGVQGQKIICKYCDTEQAL